MSETAVAVTRKPQPAKPAAVSPRPLVLLLGLAGVLGLRILLYAWAPDRSTDFDPLYDAAARLIRGENPYPPGAHWFPYPLPAVLLAVPFSALPLELARPVADVLVGWAFVFALWRYRGSYALLALASAAYIFAMREGQTTPLMVAASLVPALGLLLAVRPNTSAALWVARPTWAGILGGGAVLGVSLLILPTWPRDWWMALPPDTTQWAPPILRPFGFLLLLAALRWRSPEGRLLFAIAFIPQSTLPHELVALALVPATLGEMGIYVAGSWIAVAVAERLSPGSAEWTRAGWPATLVAVYLPMLYLVLRPTLRGLRREGAGGGRKIEKERRRPHRLPDDELKVDVTPDGVGGLTVRVTHLPTQLSTTESGPNRKLVERKAQDRLAAIVAELPLGPGKARVA